MKKSSIEDLSYLIKESKEQGLPKPIFFLGAGVSKTGGIPLAKEIVEDILDRYKEIPAVGKLEKKKHTYSELMECLTPYTRNELLKKYIEEAKINVAHIYLAQLMINNYVDYVLTVNFDNLMLRALALYNEYPPTYDMAVLKDLTTTTFKEKSVVYLHGQHHGLWLLNTDEELRKVKEVIPPILNSIKDRPWIFIGYSGEDPIFKELVKLGRFDKGLYWINYYESKLSNSVVKELLDKENTNCFVIEGYDADSFMLSLNRELHLNQPSIIEKPFSTLLSSLNEIVDIEDEEHYKGVKERLEIAVSQVQKAIQQFELGDIEETSELKQETTIDLLKKEIIDRVLNQKFDEREISSLIKRAMETNDSEVFSLLSGLYSDWGIEIVKQARLQDDIELFLKGIEKYQTATSLNPEYAHGFNNWGNALSDLAKLQDDPELYQQSFEKYQTATSLNPKYASTFNNWGSALVDFARLQSDPELYQQSFQKYQTATSLNPEYAHGFNNWGTALYDLAKLQDDPELYQQSFEKYQTATSLNPEDVRAFTNWGDALSDLAKLQDDLELYQQSFQKYQTATSLNPEDPDIFNNWGIALFNCARLQNDPELYQKSIEKYQTATSLNPEDAVAFYNWAIALSDLAKLQDDPELYQQSFEKYQTATSLNPKDIDAFYNWGNALSDLAKLQDDPELYQQSFEKYQTATLLDPEYINSFNNWGNALSDLAKLQDDPELYQQSFEKYQTATSLNPNDASIFNNWGTTLLDFARLQHNPELYQESFEKYKTASSLDPENASFFINWGSALLDFAKLKNDPDLFQKSITTLKKVVDLNGSLYNLACAYAINREKKKALKYLEHSLKHNNIEAKFVEEDEDWDEYKADEDFIKLIKKYKN